MRLLFLALRLYPYWVIPSIGILIEVWILLRRKNRPFRHWIAFGNLLLIISLFLWIYYRGSLYSDQWVKKFFRL